MFFFVSCQSERLTKQTSSPNHSLVTSRRSAGKPRANGPGTWKWIDAPAPILLPCMRAVTAARDVVVPIAMYIVVVDP